MSTDNTTRYEVFGLHDDQVTSLAERFGERVAETTDDSITVDLTNTEAHLMTGDGYFMRPAPMKP